MMRCALTVTEIISLTLGSVHVHEGTPDEIAQRLALAGLPLLQPESPFWAPLASSSLVPAYTLQLAGARLTQTRQLVLDARTRAALHDWLEVRRMGKAGPADRLIVGSAEGSAISPKGLHNLCQAQGSRSRAVFQGYVTVKCGNFVPEEESEQRTLQETAMNAETFNELMKQVARLTLHQRESLRKRLDALDGEQKALAVIESPSSDQPRSCPHCQGTALDRHGQVSGLQRYRCQTCHRTFNALTGTALARLRKKDKWLGFSAALVAAQPLRPAAAALQVHRNTTLRWRHRFLGSVGSEVQWNRKSS